MQPPFAFQAVSPEGRPPTDSSEQFQRLADEYFKLKGFEARRSNSIFAIGSPSLAGNVYVIFPYDDAAFTWSPKVADLYETVFETVYADLDFDNKKEVFALMDSFKYQNNDMQAACNSHCEIMIHGKYVAVQEDYIRRISDLFPGKYA